MKRNKFLLYSMGISLILLSACQYDNPLDIEQYMKQVYLVGANQSNNEGLVIRELPYTKNAGEETETYLSIAVGGSQVLDRDISVTISEADNHTINSYNTMYLYKATDIKYQPLNAALYNIPSYTTQIKAGEVYGKVPVKIKTANLGSDSLYAITFRISSVSEPGYVTARSADSVLMFSFRLVNEYSGNYQLSGSYYKLGTPGDTTTIALTRSLKATSYNMIRLIHLTNTETLANLIPYGLKILVNNDNTLTISAWDSLAVTDGGGAYDPVKKLFSIWYNYEVGGVLYQFKGELK